MPISFILSGLLLLYLLYITKSLKISISRSCLFLFLILYLISFFTDSLLIGKVYYNIVQLFSLLFLIIFVLKNKIYLLIRFIITAAICLCISVRLEIDNFTFAIFDIDVLVNGVYLFMLLYFLLNNFVKRSVYVKTNCFDSVAYSL